jgi:aromatic-L-amino-acid decarboxylase
MSAAAKDVSPLDLDGGEFSALMHEVVRFLAAFLHQLPVAPFMQPDGTHLERPVDASLCVGPAESGRPLQDLLRIIGTAVSSGIDTASGGALSGIPGTGLVSSAMADLIAGVLNRYTGIAVGAPAMVALEASVLRWMTDLMGLPPTAGGILTSGGSMAALSAVLCARAAKLPADFRKGRIYATDQTHHCLVKAVRIAGFPDDAVRMVPVDSGLRMDVGALRSAIAGDRDAGLIPFCIGANAGTTNTGTIDPLQELAEVARAEGLWYHVDAAYGGLFQLTDRGRKRLAGIEHADSIILDPHKGLFVPFGTGCLLVRDEEVLRQGHAGGYGPYLPDVREIESGGMRLPNFSALSPELTRPNRGLRLWLPLHLHGVAAFRRALDHKLDLALQLYDELRAMPQLHVLGEPELSVVAFRCRFPRGTQVQEDLYTEKLVKHVNAAMRVRLVTTVIRGRRVARIPILNLRTTKEILAGVVAEIRAFVSTDTTA